MLAKRNVCVKDTGGWPEAVEMYSATMLTQPSECRGGSLWPCFL